MIRRSLLASLSALFILACGAESPFYDQQEKPVIDGVPTSDWPAVGALVVDYYGQWAQYCSGTLIAPQWVLTAAHCVDEDFTGVPVEAASVYFGPDATSSTGGSTYEVDGLYAHDNWDPNAVENDIALVHLQSAVSDVTPMPYNLDSLGSYEGDPLTWVGYGTEWVNPDNPDDHQGHGIKRYGTGTLDNVYSKTIYYDASGGQLTCFGDSGGATLMTINGEERLVGVNSTVNDSYCSSGGNSTRVDYFADWVAGYVGGPQSCDITGGDCNWDEACYPSSVGGYACFPSEAKTDGQDCEPSITDTLRCADGLYCLDTGAGGICRDFCRDEVDCEAGESCILFQDSDFGFCNCTDSDSDGYCESIDCDDGNASVNPGASETCANGVDEDCDGFTDEGCCQDLDGDGYAAPSGSCPDGNDCDDTNNTVNPGQEEACGNGFDDDCDGLTDEACGDCVSHAECDDGNPCTIDACVGSDCVYEDQPDGMACGESMMCQIGQCYPTGDTGDPSGCATGGAPKALGLLLLLGVLVLRRRRD